MSDQLLADKTVPIKKRRCCANCTHFEPPCIWSEGPFRDWGWCGLDHGDLTNADVRVPYRVHPDARCGSFKRDRKHHDAD
jgi:hypothetical protein